MDPFEENETDIGEEVSKYSAARSARERGQMDALSVFQRSIYALFCSVLNLSRPLSVRKRMSRFISQFRAGFVSKDLGREPGGMGPIYRPSGWGRHSVVWGILASLIFHLLLIWIVPWRLVAGISPISESNTEIEYVFTDEPPEPDEMRYVETNPDVPSNEPDETTNIASRDQQAGQVEETTEDFDNIPFLDGEEEESVKIVEGSVMEEPIPPVPPSQQEAQPIPLSRAEVESLPRRLAKVPDFLQQDKRPEEEGIASMLEVPDIGKEEVEEKGEVEEIPLSLDALLATRAVQNESTETESETVTQLPRPRPRLSARVPPGPLMRSNGRAPALGSLSYDARFTEFGEYLNRMFDAIGFQFVLLAGYMEAALAEISSRVIVEYKITSGGEVKDVIVVYTSAESAATLICEDAIQSPSPYGPWTQEMIETLGEEQTIRITFLYR